MYDLDAHTLAREFVRRSNHYFDVWCNSEDDDFKYSLEDVVAEDEDFITFMLTLDPEGPSYREGMALMSLQPRIG